MVKSPILSRPLLFGLLAAGSIAAMQYSAPADAHWRGRGGGGGGWFAGGLVLGAVLAPRYSYPAPVYYYPPAPTYYSPAPTYYAPPPQVIYAQPPVVVQPSAPISAAPLVSGQPSTIEDRLRRLRSLCDQGLLTAQECQNRREEILREL